MASLLSVPYAVAALVLAVAGVAKLRAPEPAARAVNCRPALVRVLAAAEIVLAGLALAHRGALSAVAMAILYACFAVLTLRLARAGSACGCFGAEQAPASRLQSALSAVLAVVCGLSALARPPAAQWLLHRAPGTTLVLLIGIAGAVYGIVLAYAALPALWRSWSPA